MHPVIIMDEEKVFGGNDGGSSNPVVSFHMGLTFMLGI